MKSRVPELPLPMSFGVCDAHRKRAPAVNAEAKSEALTASAPVAGGRITDMVYSVKLKWLTLTQTTPVAPHSMRGPASFQRSGSAKQRDPVSSTGRRRIWGGKRTLAAFGVYFPIILGDGMQCERSLGKTGFLSWRLLPRI